MSSICVCLQILIICTSLLRTLTLNIWFLFCKYRSTFFSVNLSTLNIQETDLFFRALELCLDKPIAWRARFHGNYYSHIYIPSLYVIMDFCFVLDTPHSSALCNTITFSFNLTKSRIFEQHIFIQTLQLVCKIKYTKSESMEKNYFCVQNCLGTKIKIYIPVMKSLETKFHIYPI